MYAHTGNSTIVRVMLISSIVLAILMVFLCNKRFAGFFHSAKQTETKNHLLAKKEEKKKKKLYITFDDGPNRGTRNVLHIVEDERVPVSFFIVGEHVVGSAAQKRMWDSLQMAGNIELCNHGYFHAHNRYRKYYEYPDSVVYDFKRTKDSLKLTNNIARTPGRNIWRTDSMRITDLKQSAAAADSLAHAGFTVIGWDVEWKYNHRSLKVAMNAEQLYNKIDSAFAHNRTRQPNKIVLLAHDQIYANSRNSLQLKKFLQKLKQTDEFELSLISTYDAQRQSNR